MTGQLQPLSQQFPIVDPETGRPTLYFIKWAQQRQIDITGSISAGQAVEIIQQYLTDHQLQAGTGISLAPDGNLVNSPTISANVQAILDTLTQTQGSVIFRGTTDWQALAPGASGYVLQTNGAGADPTWVAQSGGGGGGGGSWAFPVQGTSYSASAFATKGWVLEPLIDISIDRVWAQITTATGQLYRATIFEVSGTTLGAKVLSETPITWSVAGAQYLVEACSETLLEKGKRYALLVTRYDGTGTSTLSLNVNVGGFPAPVNQIGYATLASILPMTGNTISTTSGLYGPVGFRFT